LNQREGERGKSTDHKAECTQEIDYLESINSDKKNLAAAKSLYRSIFLEDDISAILLLVITVCRIPMLRLFVQIKILSWIYCLVLRFNKGLHGSQIPNLDFTSSGSGFRSR
jgi:hypothetical protein